jgi:hypothetical protein
VCNAAAADDEKNYLLLAAGSNGLAFGAGRAILPLHLRFPESARQVRRAVTQLSVIRRGTAGPRRPGLRRRRRLRSLSILDLGSLMSDQTPSCRAGHGMMAGHVPYDTADGGALQTTFRAAYARQHGDRCGNCKTK